MNDFSSDLPDDLYPDFNRRFVEVPINGDTLDDGTEIVVFGDVEKMGKFNDRQGVNSLGFTETCGLVSCEDVLKQFGLDINEDYIVRYAAERGLCLIIADSPAASGGTSFENISEILRQHDVPAHIARIEDIESLALNIEQGRSIIIGVNAGVLWDSELYYDTGQANHAVVVTGIARAAHTGSVTGIFINDSGTGQSGQYIDLNRVEDAWLRTGGNTVMTDVIR